MYGQLRKIFGIKSHTAWTRFGELSWPLSEINSFGERPDSKYFELCGPYSLYGNNPTPLL